MVDSTDCVVAATPVRPDPIDNASIIVTIFDIYEKNKVNLRISWELPNATYGDVLSYEMIVTKVPLSALDSIDTAVSVIFRTSGTLKLKVCQIYINSTEKVSDRFILIHSVNCSKRACIVAIACTTIR